MGAYALAAHGAPRFTGALDLFVNPTSENARRILHALNDFGVAGIELTVADFTKPDQVVQLGVPPVRVDLVTAIDGVSWEQAWTGRLAGKYGPVVTHYLGRREFIANKRAAGRRKDLADLEALDEL